MKYILTLFIIFPFLSFAQKQDSVLFPGATKIIIKNSQTAKENYLISGNKLLANNYFIGNKDPEFFQVKSEPQSIVVESYDRLLVIYAVSNDNQIIITGLVKKKLTKDIFTGIETEKAYEAIPYKKSNLLSKEVFNRLEIYARSIGGKILYSE
ncbi:hypothetical protein [Pedobacter jejuensis]|uniref:DUF4369 domain-containing protein n=1 Tax=Pedobacter jejuensis TaxID=1268550 RepID=A0A3N0BY39_9SPHI|nr:hypothetical protein [Pedobacter jejuensis]RNL54542.1 hypothetical protein D7004_07040 [Pedobacter jejuensis]